VTTYRLAFTLDSDATFGRGDGLAGVVDAEVQHDEDGLPYLGGRALKGVLAEECANIFFALEKSDMADAWRAAAYELFGAPGSDAQAQSILHVGHAQLPSDLRAAVQTGVRRGELSREQVLESLTAIRRQTAVDPASGAPRDETLRSMRVIVRGLAFTADLSFQGQPSPETLPLLAACVKGLRRAGQGRNRGRGRLTARLFDPDGQDITDAQFGVFKQKVAP